MPFRKTSQLLISAVSADFSSVLISKSFIGLRSIALILSRLVIFCQSMHWPSFFQHNVQPYPAASAIAVHEWVSDVHLDVLLDDFIE